MANKPERRSLHFDSLDEAVAEAERLTEGEVTTTGHYSLGQILVHCARTMETVTGDLKPLPVPLPLRLAARIARPLLLRKTFSPGFKLPPKAQSLLWPDEEVSSVDGLATFKKTVERFRNVDHLKPHPVFGDMSRQQHEQTQCRHTELHLSFVHPRTTT